MNERELHPCKFIGKNTGNEFATFPLDISRLREPYRQALVLDHLGDARSRGGDLEQSRSDWTKALAIFDELNLPDAEQVRGKLAGLDESAGADSR